MTYRLLFLLAVLAMCPPVEGDVAYWVWERSKPLTHAEWADLKTAQVTRLYWQAGTLTTHDGQWRWSERFALDWKSLEQSAASLEIVPVLRLEPKEGGLPEKTFPELTTIANSLAAESGAPEIQIDYECPDRLIPNYLGFLKQLKEGGKSWRLSVSALGHWAKYANQFQGLAEEITPMFYDLNPNRETLSAGELPPLLDAPTATRQILAWKTCPLPWRVGLPNFSRLTLVDKEGVSRGNIRRWDWGDVWFSSLLQPLGETKAGETRLGVTANGVLGATPLEAGETIVARYPDREALSSLLPSVAASGAEGVIYFRLAGEDDMSGYGVQDLSKVPAAPPAFQVQTDSSTRITLKNLSSLDLMPRVFAGNPLLRGYCLVIRADAPIWRDVLPGDFAVVTRSGDFTHPADAGVTTIRFRFAHLAAQESLETGLVERAPGGESARVQWRIEPLEQENVWHDLNSSPR